MAAPGGGKRGMTEADQKLYASAERTPHKYVEGGKYLASTPAGHACWCSRPMPMARSPSGGSG